MDKYEDIINIVHFEPKHKRMSMHDRAAQFAPFAALTGFDDDVKENTRSVTKKIELTDEQKEIINNQIMIINNNLEKEVKVTYFVKDKVKDGGKYVTISNYIKRIDFVNKTIKFKDNLIIEIENIINISWQE